jgi:adenylate cyclase
MEAKRVATVLFAEPSVSSNRHEASRRAVGSAVIEIAESTGGRVVKTIGGKLMLVFATPDAAASAASKMHATIGSLPAIGGGQLGVHIAFHSGPMLQAKVSDETVRLALRLIQQAQDGQTITSQQTAEQLDPAFRAFAKSVRSPYAESDPVRLCEIASWHLKGVRPQGWSAMAVLRLTYGDQLVVCSREKDRIVMGRDEACDLVIDSMAASRQHCTLEYCRGEFLILDHSSNGTYVTVAKNAEIALLSDKIPLPEQGEISIGEPRAGAAAVVEFCYALVT